MTTRSKFRSVARRCAIAITVRAAHQTRQRLRNRLLKFTVEGSRRLIQQQDGRVLQEGACNSDALALPRPKLTPRSRRMV